jgi:predicted dehydrogenase
VVQIGGRRRTHPARAGRRRVRYAVVGLGHIAQAAVLPAFKNAGNSELAALVSDDPVKRRVLGRKYGVERSYDYAHYEDCLRSGEVDAVYIALPNHLHREYAVRAAAAGVHVLCEKPMAVTERECRAMIDACRANAVMVAYRLHFEKANLRAAESVARGDIGEPRVFNSVFTMQVREGDIRLRRAAGGGTLYDIGVYCVNAARSLFRDEPFEAQAFTAAAPDPRFKEVEEATGALLRFPGERLATFVCSFGAADAGHYDVVGSAGALRLENAYEYVGERRLRTAAGGRTREKAFPGTDQFSPELIYFSGCVLDGKEPEPGGGEGLADVRIVEALYRSARERRPVTLGRLPKRERPGVAQEIVRPAIKKPKEVRAQSPSP